MPTPYMSMSLPVPTVTPGPDWAAAVTAAFLAIDSHDHSPSHGVPLAQIGSWITGTLSGGDIFLTGTIHFSSSLAASSSIIGQPSSGRVIFKSGKDGNSTSADFVFDSVNQRTDSFSEPPLTTFLSIRNQGSELFNVSVQGWTALSAGLMQTDNATPLLLKSQNFEQGGGLAVTGTVIDTWSSYTNSGSYLLVVRNSGTDKVLINPSGTLIVSSSAPDAIRLTNTKRLHLGQGTFDYLYSDGVDIYCPTGFRTDKVAAANATSLTLKGNMVDGASALGVIVDTTAALNTSGAKILSVRNAGVEKAYIDKDGKAQFAGTTTIGAGNGTLFAGDVLAGAVRLNLVGAAADGASAVGVILNNSITLANATAKLVSIQNNGSEKAYFDKDGNVYANYHKGMSGWFVAKGDQTDTAGAVANILDNVGALTTAGAKLLSLRNAGAEKLFIDAFGLIGAPAGRSVGFAGAPTDGPTAVAVYTDVSGAALTGSGAKLLSVRNAGTEKLYVTIDGTIVSLGNASAQGMTSNGNLSGRLSLGGVAADGGTAVGVSIDNSNTLATPGAKLLSIRNNGSEKVYVDPSGAINTANAAAYIAAGGAVYHGVSANANFFAANGSNDSANIRGSVSSSNAGPAVKIGNRMALTGTSKLVSFYSDTFSTEVAYIDISGNFTKTSGPASVSGLNSTGTIFISTSLGDVGSTGTIFQQGPWAVAGGKLLIVKNGTSEHFYVDKDGLAFAKGGIQGGGSSGIADANGTYSLSGGTLSIGQITTMPGNYVTLPITAGTTDSASALGIKINTSFTYSTAGAKIISFQNGNAEKAFIDKDGILNVGAAVYPISNGALTLRSRAADGVSTHVVVGSINSLSNVSNKILSVQNAATEVAYINYSGGILPGGLNISGTAAAAAIYSGAGVPNNAYGNNGDFFFRTDTPGTTNQRLYTKSAGSWTGIL